MTSREFVSDFLAQRSLALVGMSRKGNRFGNAIYRDLKAKGYAVYPVHPEAQEIGGERCWPNLRALPEKVGGVVIVVPPAETEKVVREAFQAGIRRIWMQRGAQSLEAIRFCEEENMPVVHGECILMFAEPAALFHRLHRGLRRLFGKMPR
jgi:predicted CoA-binding protein